MLTAGIIFLLLLLLFVGMPIGFTLILVGALGIYLAGGVNAFTGLLATTPYSSVNGFSLTTIPLFILMAHFITKSNIAKELYDCVLRWIGHLPGGVGVSTVFSSAGFGTLSGSSIAATVVMSKITVPQMIRANYKPEFATGLVASSIGTLAALIPPSVPLILYGIQTETSIGQLLMAGILPGILLAFLLSLYIVIVSVKTSSKTEKFSWGERFSSLKNIWPMILLVLIVIATIYTGIGTSTEAAAFGAFGALVIGLLMRRLNVKSVFEALKEAAEQTAMIFTIVIGGHLFAYFMTLTGVSQSIVTAIAESGLSKWTVLALIVVFYLILGLFMDLIGSLILTLPLVFPIITALGFDPVWFGVIVVLLLEIGLVTPPVGINLFLVSKYTDVPVPRVFMGTIPFIIILILTVLILIIFPEIALLIPQGMG